MGTPDAGAFWRVISEHKVMALFTAPTAFRAIKKEDPDGKLLIRKSLRSQIASSAPCSSPASALTRTPSSWAEEKLKVPVVDHWWQTETGWAITSNCVGLEKLLIKPGSSTQVPSPGWDAARRSTIRRRSRMKRGRRRRPGRAKLPLPPGILPDALE